MRREFDEFEEEELDLLFIAKKLRYAVEIEKLLTDSGIDYAVEPDKYRGGVLFQSERVGAFFYVRPTERQRAADALKAKGYQASELQ